MVKAYERARRPYPIELFKFLQKVISNKNPLILDIGCGTGISTRQLANSGTTIGCDPDAIMIAAAKKHRDHRKIKYVIASAERLPFPQETFDVVTAFTSFHWFNNKKSLTEIKRILKPGGMFVIVNKTGVKGWGQGYRKAIIKTIHKPVANFHNHKLNLVKSLKRSSFHKITNKKWEQKEYYTIPQAVEYVQAISIWNSVPDQLKPKAIEGLKEYFEKLYKKQGKIVRNLTITMVIGYK